jgi:hypothetical protein
MVKFATFACLCAACLCGAACASAKGGSPGFHSFLHHVPVHVAKLSVGHAGSLKHPRTATHSH